MSQLSDADPGLTVVIPAYNEQEAIKQTITTVQQVLLTIKRQSEIIVVDDGSSDSTAEIAMRCGVRVICHPMNAGYGRALLTGIEAAKYDTIAIVDADGTYPIEYMPELVALYDQGFDMVVGARQGRHYESTVGKQLLRALFRLLAEFTSGRSIPDINSGFRVFSRAPVLEYRSSISSGFSFTTTITLFFMLSNLFVGYLPVPYEKRMGDSKVNLFRDTLRSLQIIFTAIARFNPLKLYLLLLLANVAGNLCLALLLLVALPIPVFLLFVLAIGWNSGFVMIACAVLAVATMKSSGNLVSSRSKDREREQEA